MDEKKLLEEAQKTIENINQAQETLNRYEKRLEKIISKLEYELYSEEHLTLKDVHLINHELDKEVEKQVLSSVDVNERLTEQMKQINQEALEEDDADDVVEEIVINKRGKTKVRRKKKRKLKFNVIIFVSILSLIFTLFLHYVDKNKFLTIMDKSYFIYEPADMEPSIDMNSFVSYRSKDPVVDDFVVYYDSYDQLRIKQYVSNSDEGYILINKNHTFKSEEDVKKDKVLGVVSKYYPLQGKIVFALSSSLWLMYLLTLSLFIIGLVYSPKKKKR